MGAAEVVLLGADLACPDGRRYARGAGWDEATVQTRSHWVLDGYGRRVDTTASLRGYLRDLERYIANHQGVKFINTSRKGALIQGTVFPARGALNMSGQARIQADIVAVGNAFRLGMEGMAK